MTVLELRGWRRKGKLYAFHLELDSKIFRISCQWASTSRKLWSTGPQVNQVDRKSAKSSRVVKSSTSRWSRSTKQPSWSLRSTRSTTGSTLRASTPLSSFFMRWHMPPSHTSAGACLTGWSNARPQGLDKCSVARRFTDISLTNQLADSRFTGHSNE